MLPLVILVAGAVAVAYQATALLASLIHAGVARLRYRKPPSAPKPPISILKPVRGLDEGFAGAIRSHAVQDYPEYEILFGVRDLDDPAVPVIRALIAAHPTRSIRLVHCPEDAPNAKVAILIELEKQAQHAILLVNDADITVPRDYLQRVVAPLDVRETGVVTCLYRATASSAAGQWEALGIATDFIPSTLVAPLVGVKEFGLGSTLCFRAEDLKAIGGFEALKEYIADDYQLAKRITALGRRSFLSEVVVSTTLSDPGWVAVWRHQLRWARTIRVSRGGGYLGLPVTQAGLWAVLNCLVGNWSTALVLLVARISMGAVGGFVVLRHWPALLAAPLIPLWDLWAFVVWLAGLMGRSVYWRNRKTELLPDGRMKDPN
ncbi:glycosyltransferase [uncultured Paludibaculum sp.]|uniref:glycosyltransferase n=1 Tax=uncultured Paludibaculum sp. TaxID=1765020 RepID=UPI002AABE63A|nr:glycosyltransferase [uncultured Paludibaculum sp.]